MVATPQGLVAIEVKDYSGWLFGSERQRYWTQILNYGKEKYRFYNPIMQNAGHIKALKEQSAQFAQLPIYNIVLFDGDCTLKDVSYSQFGTFVGYAGNIMRVLKTIKGFGEAEYTDKKRWPVCFVRLCATGRIRSSWRAMWQTYKAGTGIALDQ